MGVCRAKFGRWRAFSDVGEPMPPRPHAGRHSLAFRGGANNGRYATRGGGAGLVKPVCQNRRSANVGNARPASLAPSSSAPVGAKSRCGLLAGIRRAAPSCLPSTRKYQVSCFQLPRVSNTRFLVSICLPVHSAFELPICPALRGTPEPWSTSRPRGAPSRIGGESV